jgi:hypothetical protein
MTSLADVYEGQLGEEASRRRLVAGVGLFLAGALLVGVGIVAATTNFFGIFGLNTWQSWEVAGTLAGLGLPAVFVGVFMILPASDQQRAAAAIGASVAVLGVAFFLYAFPGRWHGDPQNLTLPVVTVYSLGTLVTFWCLFVAIANFKTRNDPGGTVTLEIKREGGVQTVEVTKSDLKKGDLGPLGSVGVLGNLPENEPNTKTKRQPRRATPTQSVGARATSDGGTTTQQITSPLDGGAESHGYDAQVIDQRTPAVERATTDTYCGNCAHFEYVRTERGMQPYCALHAEAMEDMESCTAWEPNNYR